MIRRDIGNEAGARSDGVMIVSIIFITAFTYIALTTDPVYTGIGVGDRAPDLNGQIYDGTVWDTVAGSSGAVSQTDAQNIALELVLSLG